MRTRLSDDRRFRQCCAAGAALLLLHLAASASEGAVIPINNGSFETPLQTGSPWFQNVVPTGWQGVATVGTSNLGVQHASAPPVPLPSHLNQDAFMNTIANTPLTLWQKPLLSLQPNTIYRLTFDVANRDRGNDGYDARDFQDATTTIAAFFTLGAANDSLAQAVGTKFQTTLDTIPNGQWALSQTAIFSTVGLANLNQSLNFVIYARNSAGVGSPNNSTLISQVNWDNIRLEALPVPEPEAGTLCGGALVVGALLRRVRRRAR